MTKIQTRAYKRLSAPAIKHLVVFNMACGILKVRKFKDVVHTAVNLTDDKKQLNSKRKLIAQIETSLDLITAQTDAIFSQLSLADLDRIKKGHTAQMIEMIPEHSTSPEVLGLYLLYLEFQDAADKKLDPIMQQLCEFDYIKLIWAISEEVGLQKDVSDDMYYLAMKLIEEIKK
ncbi:MAG: hypothetical protein IBX43_05145 [Campylobacterales bacterium]|nr:hypothetical protein [Campylobacterales bacterium]